MEITDFTLYLSPSHSHRLTQKIGVLQDTLSQSEKDRASELSHLTAQLSEVSARCEGLQRELVEYREEGQAKTREQVSRRVS